MNSDKKRHSCLKGDTPATSCRFEQLVAAFGNKLQLVAAFGNKLPLLATPV